MTDLHLLSKLAIELREAELEAQAAELELKSKKARVRRIAQEDIPEVMQRVGIKNFETMEGLKISLKEDVFASISEMNQFEAYQWLDENGHGGIIKRQVLVAFNRDEQDRAFGLLDQLREQGFREAKVKGAIHWKTLASWAKGMLEDGRDIPETISIERKLTAKVK